MHFNLILWLSCDFLKHCSNVLEMLDFSFGDQAGPGEGKLLDHRPLKLNTDDYERVKKIPYKKVGG
jgi:hypothetical protein